MTEKLRCDDCGHEFTHGDTLYFKPIPYLDIMDGGEVILEPYCKYCITSHAINFEERGR